MRALPPPPLQHAPAKRKKEATKGTWLPCHIQQFVLAQLLNSSFFLYSATMQTEALLRQGTKQREEDSTWGSLGNDRDLLITLPYTLFTVNCGFK